MKRLTYFSIVFILCMGLVGCASMIARPGKVIVFPEERIFLLESGTEVSVALDSKPQKMVFPEKMFLVSSTVLVKQEAKLNNALLDKVKADSDKKKQLGIIGSIFAIFAAGLGIFFKMKKWGPQVSAKVDIK